jgi:stage V sporulation protein B
MTRLKRYLANGFLMTCVALTLRGLAVVFNAYISKKIGAEALGLYTLLGSVYSFALTLALSGINLTVTRLVSDALGENNAQKVRVSMKKCIEYSLFSAFFRLLCCSSLQSHSASTR